MKMTKNKIMNMISTRRDDNEYNMIMIMMLIMNITSTRWDDARVWCVEVREGGVEGRHQWISCQKLEYIERNISPKMYIFSEIRNQWIYCHQWEYFQTNILPSFNILSKIEIFWKMNYKTMVMSPWNQNYLLLPKICMKEIFTTLHASIRWLCSVLTIRS